MCPLKVNRGGGCCHSRLQPHLCPLQIDRGGNSQTVPMTFPISDGALSPSSPGSPLCSCCVPDPMGLSFLPTYGCQSNRTASVAALRMKAREHSEAVLQSANLLPAASSSPTPPAKPGPEGSQDKQPSPAKEHMEGEKSVWGQTGSGPSAQGRDPPPGLCRGVNCSVAVPQQDVTGPPGTSQIWVAFLAAFHTPLLFLRRCRFIPLIYQHYLCLETFVKLFLAPPLPSSQGHRNTQDPDLLPHISGPHPVRDGGLAEGWRFQMWGPEQERHPVVIYPTVHRRSEGICRYIPVWPAVFWWHLTSTKSIPGKPGVKEAENKMKLFIIFSFSLLFPESETFHGVDYWEIAENSLPVNKILALVSMWPLVCYSCHSLG